MRSLTASIAMLLTLAGCSVEPPSLGTNVADKTPQHGHVFLVRGLLGTFSTGMDDLRDTLRQNGIPAVALQHTAEKSAAHLIAEHPELREGPLIIIGYSLGAGAAVEICDLLAAEHIPVDLLITLDPVSADRVPPNVKLAVNYYRSGGMADIIPLFRGVALREPDSGGGQLYNVDLNRKRAYLEPGTNHFNIDTNGKLQHAMLQIIIDVCSQTDGLSQPQMASTVIHPTGVSPPSTQGTYKAQ